MSSEALAWAFKQDVKPSGAKFTLVALCECANYKTGRITPSIAHLVEITGQNRKSIIGHIDQLERQGFITDTGERTGTTKQIKVYSANIGTVPQQEQSQNRNSSNSDLKQSQKRDTEPSWEPSTPDIANAISPPVLDDGLTEAEVIEAWNGLARDLGLPTVSKLTTARKRKLACRIRDHPFDDWAAALAAIRRSQFLCGDNDRGWRANFDWLIRPETIPKLLEGQYDEQTAAR